MKLKLLNTPFCLLSPKYANRLVNREPHVLEKRCKLPQCPETRLVAANAVCAVNLLDAAHCYAYGETGLIQAVCISIQKTNESSANV